MLFSLAKVKQVSKKSLECFLFECPLMVALSQSKSRCPVSSKCLYIVEVVEISFWSFHGALLFLTLIHDLSLQHMLERQVSPTYVGETGRELKLRIKEHQENSRKKLPTSTIYKHLEETGHRDFDWDNATIKGHSNRKHSRLFLETCFTLANENNINRHIDIPEVYRAAINNIIH